MSIGLIEFLRKGKLKLNFGLKITKKNWYYSLLLSMIYYPIILSIYFMWYVLLVIVWLIKYLWLLIGKKYGKSKDKDVEENNIINKIETSLLSMNNKGKVVVVICIAIVPFVFLSVIGNRNDKNEFSTVAVTTQSSSFVAEQETVSETTIAETTEEQSTVFEESTTEKITYYDYETKYEETENIEYSEVETQNIIEEVTSKPTTEDNYEEENYEEDYNYEEIVYWTDDGKKYHSNKNCSNMVSPHSGTISEAGDREPCKKCY